MWHPDMPLEYRNQIVTGDARELAKAIPDESVDLVMTDPPYNKDDLGLYEWVSAESARVLKPGGFLFAYGGMVHPEVETLLSLHLDWFFVHALLHMSAGQQWWAKHLFINYKPVYQLIKGKPRLDSLPWVGTAHHEHRDKNYHEWQQGSIFPTRMIDAYTDLANVVWEPFTGGGTIPAVCKMLGRNYIAFEIDPITAETARQRVAQTQVPWFVEMPEQLTLLDGGP